MDDVELPFFLEGVGLRDYHRYLTGEKATFNPYGLTSSFLPRFSGLYGLQIGASAKTYLIVFENLFPPGVPLKEQYDLKGALGSKRNVTEKQRTKGIKVLKDRNFLNRTLNVGEKLKPQLLDQLRRDLDFLKLKGRIDYSLLLGVASIDDVKQLPHA